MRVDARRSSLRKGRRREISKPVTLCVDDGDAVQAARFAGREGALRAGARMRAVKPEPGSLRDPELLTQPIKDAKVRW